MSMRKMLSLLCFYGGRDGVCLFVDIANHMSSECLVCHKYTKVLDITTCHTKQKSSKNVSWLSKIETVFDTFAYCGIDRFLLPRA